MYDILTADFPTRWRNTVMLNMWAGHEQLLILYGLSIYYAVADRNIDDAKSNAEYLKLKRNRKTLDLASSMAKPDWLTDQPVFDRVVTSHRKRLWEKYPIYETYEQWKDLPDVRCHPGCSYFWPIEHKGTSRTRII